MTIDWTMNNPHGVDESAVDALTDVLWNGAITKSSTDHFTVKVADIKIVFDGDFTGDPVSAGAITGFHLFQEGVRTLDASGYNLDFHDVLEGIQNAGGDGAALLAILEPGPMNIIAERHYLGQQFCGRHQCRQRRRHGLRHRRERPHQGRQGE
jgi:hypothetical protein